MRVIWVSHSKELQATNLQTGKQQYKHITTLKIDTYINVNKNKIIVFK